MSWLGEPNDADHTPLAKRVYYRVVISLFREWLVRPIDVLVVGAGSALLVGIVLWPDSWPMRAAYVGCAAFLAMQVARGRFRRGSFQWMLTGLLLLAEAYTIWTWL